MDNIQKAKISLLRLCRAHIKSNEDYDRIKLAIVILIRKQGNQMRYEGTEYPLHPMQVAYNLIKKLKTHDSNIIVAAILHDIMEDTDISESEIRSLFGERVLALIQYLTNPKCPSKDEAERRLFYQKHILQLIERDEEAFFIKLYDLETNALHLDKLEGNPKLQKKLALKYLPLVEAFSSKAMELAIKYDRVNHRYAKELFELSRRFRDAFNQIRIYSKQRV